LQGITFPFPAQIYSHISGEKSSHLSVRQRVPPLYTYNAGKEKQTSYTLYSIILFWCQFHQRFTRAFFVRKFVQSQNVTRKKAFVCKICAFNVDEFDQRFVGESLNA